VDPTFTRSTSKGETHMTQRTGGSDWINAYLEWTETDAAPSAKPGAVADASRESLREAILLMALRTESECMHILRQALDDGEPTPQTLRLAMEAIDCAKTLVADERRAWQALRALRLEDQPLAWIAWAADSRMDWPYALEDVEADVRALSGRILELRAH
jgi:hypothetical protein